MREFIPRPYQPQAIEFMLTHPRCGLFAGMGMGKTITTYTLIDRLLLSGEINGPILVLAPLRVACSTWPEEQAKWAHLTGIKVEAITGTPPERVAAMRRKADVYCTNYENIPWLVETLGGRWPFAMVIADESTRLKGFRTRQGTARSRALASVAFKSKRFVLLTGTPAPNGLIDLWGQLWFIDQGQRLGRTFEAFKQRWFKQDPNGFSIQPLPFAQDQIQDAIRDVCLTLDPTDWFDLEAPVVVPRYVDLPARAHLLYQTMEKELFIELVEGEAEALNAAAKTNKLLQLANGAVYLDRDADGDSAPTSKEYVTIHDEKIEALKSIVEELAGAPLLVAYKFRSDLSRLRQAFPKGRVLDKNPMTLVEWNHGEIPVLFAHPASAGHGLNLQDGGHHIAFFGHDWNLEEYQQILERIGPVRQMQAGYKRAVILYQIIARNTVDEIVIARRESKRDVQDLLLEAFKRKYGV